MFTIEYVSNDPGSKEFYLTIGIPVGSVNEDKKMTGVSHLLEHLFFIHPKHRESYLTIKTLCIFNAYTTTDWTMFFIKCDIKDAKVCAKSLLNLLIDFHIDKDGFNKEKRVVIEEMLKDDIKKETGYGNAYSLLTEGTPYGNSVIGNFNSIKKMNHRDVLEYYRTKYKDAFIVYSCRNKEKDVIGLHSVINTIFKNSRFAKTESVTPHKEVIQYKVNKDKPVIINYKTDKNLQKTGINIAFKTCRFSDELRPVFDRYSYIVHELLFRVVREENALIYSSNVEHEGMRNIGVFELFVSSYWTGSNITRFLDLIIQVLLESSTLVYKDEWIERYNTRKNIKSISDSFLKVKEKTYEGLYSFTTNNYNMSNPRVAICIKSEHNKDKKPSVQHLEEKLLNVISQIFINLSMKIK